ncbi:MAG: hypothetical protein ACYCX3_12730 [Thermoleophilia bacterium]
MRSEALAVLALLAVALAAAGCHGGTVARTTSASSTGLRGTVTTAAGSATDGAAGSVTTGTVLAGSSGPFTSSSLASPGTPSILFPQADMQTPILLFPYGKDLFLATIPNGDTIYCLDAEARVRWSTRVERQQRFDLSTAFKLESSERRLQDLRPRAGTHGLPFLPPRALLGTPLSFSPELLALRTDADRRLGLDPRANDHLLVAVPREPAAVHPNCADPEVEGGSRAVYSSSSAHLLAISTREILGRLVEEGR